MRPGLNMMLSFDNENHEEPKAIEAAEEIKKQRESEQLNVDPEEIIEEEERRQPHSVDEE